VLPTREAYTKSVEKFLAEPVLKEVKNFTAFNEPNRPEISTGKDVKGATRAGEFWQVLDGLCNPKRNSCYVAARDFADQKMEDAYRPRKEALPNSGYNYFQAYLKGMSHPTTGYRWAWHSYTDGENTGKLFRGRPNRWWQRFKNFRAAINRVSEHARYKPPEIWLTEQGVVYERTENKKHVVAFAGRTANSGRGDGILRAYVEHGSSQLTRQSKQITASPTARSPAIGCRMANATGGRCPA
jgi:hypothetical protein